MVPGNIKKQDIDWANDEIFSGRRPVCLSERSKCYCLVDRRGHLPPKVVIRVANKKPNEIELTTHKGGDETNEFLRSRGFTVIDCTCGGSPH